MVTAEFLDETGVLLATDGGERGAGGVGRCRERRRRGAELVALDELLRLRLRSVEGLEGLAGLRENLIVNGSEGQGHRGEEGDDPRAESTLWSRFLPPGGPMSLRQ